MQQTSSVPTVERGVPSVCPPGWRRGARGRRPRADTRCWVWCRDTTAREAAIRSCSEDSRSAGTWGQTLAIRAVNEPSRSFAVPRNGLYGLLFVESTNQGFSIKKL